MRGTNSAQSPKSNLSQACLQGFEQVDVTLPNAVAVKGIPKKNNYCNILKQDQRPLKFDLVQNILYFWVGGPPPRKTEKIEFKKTANWEFGKKVLLISQNLFITHLIFFKQFGKYSEGNSSMGQL